MWGRKEGEGAKLVWLVAGQRLTGQPAWPACQRLAGQRCKKKIGMDEREREKKKEVKVKEKKKDR